MTAAFHSYGPSEYQIPAVARLSAGCQKLEIGFEEVVSEALVDVLETNLRLGASRVT